MHKKLLFSAILFTISLMMTYAIPSPAVSEAPRISKEELKDMIDSPDLVIIDLRTEKEWKKADLKIKHAVWKDAEEYETWAAKYPKEKTIVFY